MKKQEMLIEIQRVKNESSKLQSKLAQELKELEQAVKCHESRRRMAEISVLHAKDLWNTCNDIIDLERKLNLL
ncbi:MAG: hypothetical protein WED10_09230 [Brumimicrobium sp.]